MPVPTTSISFGRVHGNAGGKDGLASSGEVASSRQVVLMGLKNWQDWLSILRLVSWSIME
jgi:hypothetical protein